MGIFQNAEYREIEMPIEYIDDEEDQDAGTISIQAYGSVDGSYKYCLMSYSLKKRIMYNNGDYEELLEKLKDTDGKMVKVQFKYKKDKVKEFKLNLESLAKVYNDERFLQLDLVSWGLNDRSWKDIIMNDKKKF